MSPSEHSEALRKTGHVKEHCGNPGVAAVPKEFGPSEQPSRTPVGPFTPDEGASETFVGGAGI
jgi:hypothetical protein